MKSFEWDPRKGVLVSVDDPCYQEDESDHNKSIFNAGYYPELDSGEGIGAGGSITVYRKRFDDDSARPEFYLDLWGSNSNLGTFVARDFPSLVETLRYLEPVLKVLNLDQRSSARLMDQIKREAGEA